MPDSILCIWLSQYEWFVSGASYRNLARVVDAPGLRAQFAAHLNGDLRGDGHQAISPIDRLAEHHLARERVRTACRTIATELLHDVVAVRIGVRQHDEHETHCRIWSSSLAEYSIERIGAEVVLEALTATGEYTINSLYQIGSIYSYSMYKRESKYTRGLSRCMPIGPATVLSRSTKFPIGSESLYAQIASHELPSSSTWGCWKKRFERTDLVQSAFSYGSYTIYRIKIQYILVQASRLKVQY